MRKNEMINLRGEKLGAELEGICHHEGMTVFVPGLLPGEEAAVRIVKAQKRYAFGRIEGDIRNVSPERREPGCSAYPRCGGCSGRHMLYAATLEAKRQQVQDCLQRIGGIRTEVPPVIGMSDPTGYRNKTSLPATEIDGKPVLGFYAPRSHRVIPMTRCPNAMEPAGEIADIILKWMKEYNISAYQEEAHQGLIRHVVIRVNRTGESMVTLAINGDRLPHTEQLIRQLQPLNVVSLWINENRERTNVILSEHFLLLYGRKTLTDTLCGLRFELSPGAFFQVNPEQTEKLYQTALEFASPGERDTVCDVYCGAGTITLMMAQHCRQAIGIEYIEAAVENARENARRNGIENAVFHAGKAEELLPEMVKTGLQPDIIIVDPPRKGMDEAVIRAITEAGPRHLVYVSCNPATLARDAGLLQELGYRAQKVQPVDMFCWTSGIETVVLFSQPKESAE